MPRQTHRALATRAEILPSYPRFEPLLVIYVHDSSIRAGGVHLPPTGAQPPLISPTKPPSAWVTASPPANNTPPVTISTRIFTSVTTRHTLASTPVEGSLFVEVDGVQELEFTVSGNVVSLNEAPVMGASVVIRYVAE